MKMGSLRKATKFLSGQMVSKPIFEPQTSQIRERNTNHFIADLNKNFRIFWTEEFTSTEITAHTFNFNY
jgi:hypothetical protein